MRSAGRVLIIPKGDYDPNVLYEMLDLVTYEGMGYICKKETIHHAPTNETYWQKIGNEGGGDPSTYMLIDGSNADILRIANDPEITAFTIQHANITKAAGLGETLSIQVNSKWSSEKGKLTYWLINRLKAHIGDEDVYFTDTDQNKYYVIIDNAAPTVLSYDTDDDVITVTAHLKTDVSDAISLTDRALAFNEYIDETNVIRGYSFGQGNAIANNLSLVGGVRSVASGVGSHAYGADVAAGSYSHAEGRETNADLYSHAEGRYTSAQAEGAHAEGTGTIASESNQHVSGQWNLPKWNTLFEIGNGTSANRSNVFEIYSDGSISFNNGTEKYKFAKVDGVNGFYDKNNNFHKMEETTLTQDVTLSTAGTSQAWFVNNLIKADSIIDVYTSQFGLTIEDMTISAGSCLITFPIVETAATITVKIIIR